MKLSDGTIRKMLDEGQIAVTPDILDHQLQPCSIDLRLSSSFYARDWRNGGPAGWVRSTNMKLMPGVFMLAATLETIRLSSGFVGTVVGKSTLARKGLQVESAGLVDPGFEGTITLEMVNLSRHPIDLAAGDMVCQITFERLDWPAVRPYGHPALRSQYQHQTRATPAPE